MNISRNTLYGISAILVVIVLAVALLQLSGIGLRSLFVSDDRGDIIHDQLQEKNEEIAKLKKEKGKHIAQVMDLRAEIQRLNASRPDGGAVEEKRKALVEKEAALQHREHLLTQREEAMRLAEIRIDEKQREFYESRNLTLEQIGEAKQVLKEYEYMRMARERAEGRANNWLMGIAIGIAGLILIVIFGAMRMVPRNKRTDDAFRTLNTIKNNTEEHKLLIASLGDRMAD